MTFGSEPRSFLSYLRERSAIVFTIGLALSVASFVENLQMGKEAIAYVVAELSKIEGWADAVKAVAAIFHGALEWWRGVLQQLAELSPIRIPPWMHDSLSILFFGFSRMISRARTMRLDGLPGSTQLRGRTPTREASLRRRGIEIERYVSAILFESPLYYVLPLIALYYVDMSFYRKEAALGLSPESASLLFVAVVFLLIFAYGRYRVHSAGQRRY